VRSIFELLDFTDELANVFELAVYRDVAHVGYGVDVVEFVHDLDADDVRWALREVVLVEFGEDFFDSAVETVHGYRTFFTGFDQPAEEFFAVDGLAGAISFDHPELGALNLFVGGVAVIALEAFATATRGRSVFRHPRVDYFIF
jgi:hypothetical protein